jgi:hypothetical protein
MNIFARITKVDAANRLVHGVMAEEKPDKSGEVFDYESSKPYVKEWSDDAVTKTHHAGQDVSYGNVRAQHNGKIAAGKLVSLDFDDKNKEIPIIAKIVDEQEWKKVEEGVYTGFSIGGDYVKRWADGKHIRYTARPKEVSIVDNPCMYGATFTMVKADGAEEQRNFPGVVISREAVKEKLGSELPPDAIGFHLYGADGNLGKRYVFEQENSAAREESMDVQKLEELAKSVEKLQADTAVLKKMSAENQAHLHALVIHHNGMGDHLHKMLEACAKAVGSELTAAQKAEIEKSAGFTPKVSNDPAPAANAELAAFKEEVTKSIAALAEIVTKLAKSPVSNGVTGTPRNTGENGKGGDPNPAPKPSKFVVKSEVAGGNTDAAEAELRKALENGKPVVPVLE